MSKKTVRHALDTLPPLTAAQKQYLDDLASLPDHTGEMPELTAAQLSGMKPAALYRPVKKQITVRVDADVLAWLKSQGKGYQSRMNAILRREMLAARKMALGLVRAPCPIKTRVTTSVTRKTALRRKWKILLETSLRAKKKNPRPGRWF